MTEDRERELDQAEENGAPGDGPPGDGGSDAEAPGLAPPVSPGARASRPRARDGAPDPGEPDDATAGGEEGGEERSDSGGDGGPGDGDDGEGRSWSARQMELADTLTQEPIAPRVYYSIGEVCDLTGLKPHVLRYWESQFEVMNPNKNRAGNRVYRPKDIDLIFLVRRLLYEEKYTIEGARKRLLEMRREGALDEEKQEVLGSEFLAEMKRELLALQNILSLTEPGD